MSELVSKIEKRLLPEFESMAEQIELTFVDVSASVESCSVGSLTEYQGHQFSIICCFTDIRGEDSDAVDLTVSLCHLTTVPKINAEVSWCLPTNYSEVVFLDWHRNDEWPIVSEKVMHDLYAFLPKLYDGLFEALKRRKPVNEKR